MKILFITPWPNVWLKYFKPFFESKGHTFDFDCKLQVNKVNQYDILMSAWADDGVRWLASHPKLCRKYICWIRSYEFWHNNMGSIDWTKFDRVLFTNKYIMEAMKLPNGAMVHNAIDLQRVPYKEKKPGKQVLFLADLNFKKGIPLLMQIAMKLPDYTFNIYGNIDSKRDYLYLRYYNLPNLKVRGYAKDINKVFDSHNYILLSSPVEGNPNCIIEGMSSGLKPVVHRFVGSEGQYPKDCMWDSIDQAVEMLTDNKYDSKSYRRYIEDNYDMWEVYKKLEELCI